MRNTRTRACACTLVLLLVVCGVECQYNYTECFACVANNGLWCYPPDTTDNTIGDCIPNTGDCSPQHYLPATTCFTCPAANSGQYGNICGQYNCTLCNNMDHTGSMQTAWCPTDPQAGNRYTHGYCGLGGQTCPSTEISVANCPRSGTWSSFFKDCIDCVNDNWWWCGGKGKGEGECVSDPSMCKDNTVVYYQDAGVCPPVHDWRLWKAIGGIACGLLLICAIVGVVYYARKQRRDHYDQIYDNIN